jgi:hypothetical protein
LDSVLKFIIALTRRVLDLERPYKIALGSIVLALLLVLIFPFKSITAPAWSLKVVDNSNQVVPAINVTEHWQHYLLESEGHEEMQVTASDGTVEFPERTIRASLIRRFTSNLSKFFAKGREARKDAYAAVVVWGSKNHETAVVVLKPLDTPPDKIVVVRNRYYARLAFSKNLLSE